jgi:hypothetical protein
MAAFARLQRGAGSRLRRCIGMAPCGAADYFSATRGRARETHDYSKKTLSGQTLAPQAATIARD